MPISGLPSTDQNWRILRSVFDAVQTPTVVLDADLRIVAANRAARAQCVEPAPGLVGCHCGAFIRRNEDSCARAQGCPARRAFETGETCTAIYCDGGTDVPERIFEYTLSPLEASDDGTSQYIVGTAKDITGRRRGQEALAQSERRLREAQRTGRIGSWEWIRDTNRTHWSDEVWRLYGLEPPRGDSDETPFAARVLGDDERRLRRIVAKALARRESYGADYRVRRTDGQVRVLHSRCSPTIDAEGRVTGVHGTVQDITEQHRAKEAARREAAKLSAMIGGMQEGIVFADADDTITAVNDYFCTFVGKARDEILGSSLLAFHDAELRSRIAGLLASYRRVASAPPFEVQREVGGAHVILRMQAIYRDGVYDGALLNVIDVTELARQRERAEAASASKSAFLANMSHEIRTPLNGVIGMTDLVLEGSLTTEQREYLTLARTSADALLTVINDILDFSKIEAGKIDLHPEDFVVEDLVDQVVRGFTLQARQRDVRLTFRVAPDVPRSLCGDPGRLRQILLNLVGNAVKFTEDGEVETRVTRLGTRRGETAVHVWVRDTGIGVAEAQRRRIFEEFEQADGSTTRRFGGTGLGLPIAKRLVALMGGRMWVDSTEGVGTTFHFVVRLGRAASALPVVRPTEPRRLGGLRVLLVDGNGSQRRALKDQLASRHLDVAEADSGEAALARLACGAGERPPTDLILIDALLPGMDGFELAGRVHATDWGRDLPMVVLAATGRRGDAGRCRAAGIGAYLRRPVSLPELLETIGRLRAQRAGEVKSVSLITRHRLRESSGLRVLVAEDNIVNQRLARAILERMGHTVSVVDNGAEALREVQAKAFDVVVMDVQMPEMDGLEATQRIRELEGAESGIPIVAMTAHALKGDRERCLEAGMSDYVSKPVRADALREALERATASRPPVGAGLPAAREAALAAPDPESRKPRADRGPRSRRSPSPRRTRVD